MEFKTKATKRAEEVIEAITVQNNLLNKTVGIMLSQLEDLQEYDMSGRNRDNPYSTKSAQVLELRNKYRGIGNLGAPVLQRLINLRVAFSVPNRLFLTTDMAVKKKNKLSDKQVEDSKNFLGDFMAINGLDAEVPRELCKESELQGQVALGLVWDRKQKNVVLKYYPWNQATYTIKQETRYAFKGPRTFVSTLDGKRVTLSDNKFVYIGFNDELSAETIQGYPTCGPILKTIENLYKDLLDWRKLNHLFAHPTPHFQCETKDEADAINNLITTLGWKIGTAIATNGNFQLKGPSGAEANLLMLAITTAAKIISAHTGIGIHFLGFANVMSNRATADSMGEPTEVVLHSEITSWTGFYVGLFRKAIIMRNAHLQGQLPTNVVLPRLIPLTDRQWRVIKDIYLPLFEKKAISHVTLLNKIPDLDAEEELEKIKDEERKSEENSNENNEEENSEETPNDNAAEEE
ncbi:MAG: hypothetical protein FVQ80_11415 [Planctomycetes bacterium]|nr:hypothetical protein [Planctomycetota bacterium]